MMMSVLAFVMLCSAMCHRARGDEKHIGAPKESNGIMASLRYTPDRPGSAAPSLQESLDDSRKIRIVSILHLTP
jgi:hypothetical protein